MERAQVIILAFMNANGTFERLPFLFGEYDFRLGAPSNVYPAGIIANVETLGPCVDNIELMLFDSPQLRNLPSPENISRLAEIADRYDLSYTVHLPAEYVLGSVRPAERAEARRQIIRITQQMRPLAPYAYVLHLEGISPNADRNSVLAWQDVIAAELSEIVTQAGGAERLCMENLNYPFEWCEVFLELFQFSVCVDIGHLWFNRMDVQNHLDLYRERMRVIHVHGFNENADHLSLKTLPAFRFRQMMRCLEGFTGVVTLEMFKFEELRESIERLSAWLES